MYATGGTAGGGGGHAPMLPPAQSTSSNLLPSSFIPRSSCVQTNGASTSNCSRVINRLSPQGGSKNVNTEREKLGLHQLPSGSGPDKDRYVIEEDDEDESLSERGIN